MPWSAGSFPPLQRSCVLAPSQKLGFNGVHCTLAGVCAHRPMTTHRGICPSMSAFKCSGFLALWENDTCLSSGPKRSLYFFWPMLDVTVTIPLISKWSLRLKSSSVQSSWNSTFSFYVPSLLWLLQALWLSGQRHKQIECQQHFFSMEKITQFFWWVNGESILVSLPHLLFFFFLKYITAVSFWGMHL